MVPFEANKETHSQARHLRKFQDCADHPETRMRFPTVHWTGRVRAQARALESFAAKVPASEAGTCPASGHARFAQDSAPAMLLYFGSP